MKKNAPPLARPPPALALALGVVVMVHPPSATCQPAALLRRLCASAMWRVCAARARLVPPHTTYDD
jgi:hypothetical protein